MDTATLSARARKLGSVLEPLTGQVYFSPECHENYVKLGFDPSPGKANGVALPDGPAYFTSRGSVMGQVAGEVVAAAFGVFNPEVVVPMVTLGWTRTDAPTICHARDDGGIAQLERILGEKPEGIDRVNELLARAVEPLRPEGRPLYSGLRSQALPDSKVGTMWRRGDMLREYRGDSHVTSWVSAGMTATEIGLLTELYWGLPMRTYSRTRAWTDSQFDAATEALKGRGLIDDTGFTPEGREARELIETVTDAQMAPAIRALGDDIDELFEILEPWGARVRECFGYLSSGPHDLARKASSFAS
jgi:Helix-turn-helix family